MSAKTSPDPAPPRVVILDDRRLVADSLRAACRDAGLAVSDDDTGDVAIVRDADATFTGPVLRVEDFSSLGALVAAAARIVPSGGHVYVTATVDAPVLTPREQVVLDAVGRGESAKDIAVVLGISPRTVERHKQSVTAKLGVGSHAGALARDHASRTRPQERSAS